MGVAVTPTAAPFRRLGPCEPLCLAYGAHGFALDLRIKTFDVEAAIEVVALVLDSLSQQAVSVEVDLVAIEVDSDHARPRVPAALKTKARNAQAAFLDRFRFAAYLGQFGIEYVAHDPIDVVAECTQRHPYLGRGHTSATGHRNGVEQVGYQCVYRRIYAANGVGCTAKHGVAE